MTLPDDPLPILYVDDERANLVVFKATIGRGFDVIVADSGASALEILETQGVDVLITDNRMPSMTGVELCERVRQKYPDIERILITAYTDLDTVVEAVNRGGISRYLAKPWDPEEVRSALREAQANARRSRMARLLQASIAKQERLTAVASMRGHVLHDLANVASRVVASCDELETLQPELVGSGLADDLLVRYRKEVGDLRIAVDYLRQLHTRVRGLHRSPDASPVPILLADLLHSAATVGRAHLEGGATLAVQCPPGLLAMGDRTDLGRILVNLLTNAAHALQGVPAGKVQLIAEEGTDGQVVVAVVDNGPGIPDELRQRIFEDDFTTRPDEGGTGQGLAISRRLAEANDGVLRLAPGGPGARFELVLRGLET